MNAQHRFFTIKTLIWIVSIIIVLLVAVAAWAFLWPGRSADLQKAEITRREYADSVAAIQSRIQADTADKSIQESCRPILKTHDKKTAKAVLLLHGISGCPDGMSGLADWFYEAGYNVYVPRLPEHGTYDSKRHSEVRAKQLVDFMSESASDFSGLGDELGIIGHSGGGNLSTWLVQYGDGLFSRALLLAPFYEPDPKHAPKWQLAPLRNIYGSRLIPDNYYDNLSYRALASFLTIKQNYRTDNKAEGLRHMAVVYSSLDGLIDKNLAEQIPRATAEASGASFKRILIPEEYGIEHSVLEPNVPEVAAHKDELYKMYLNAYENN